MAFKKIEVGFSGNGSLPWLNDWCETNPTANGFVAKVERLTFGDKGVIIATTHFQAFFYKSNPYYAFLLEAVQVWVTGNVPTFALMFQVDTSDKANGYVGIDSELESDWVKKTETTYSLRGRLDTQVTVVNSNPLLNTPSKPDSKNRTRGRKKADREGVVDEVDKAATSLANASNGSVLPDTSIVIIERLEGSYSDD